MRQKETRSQTKRKKESSEKASLKKQRTNLKNAHEIAEEFPSCLKCPCCEKLFINPEMFVGCGHTICRVCVELKQSNSCPVCKHTNWVERVPNKVLQELIDTQYPKAKGIRQEELNEIQKLREKLDTYKRSTRLKKLVERLMKFVKKKSFCNYHQVLSHLVECPEYKNVSQDEAKFIMMHCINCADYILVGEYLVDSSKTIESMVESVEKKKSVLENKKWLPLVMLCQMESRSSHNFKHETFKKMAQLSNLDIGEEIPLQEWKEKPHLWLNNIEIKEEISDSDDEVVYPLCDYGSEFRQFARHVLGIGTPF